MNHSCSLEGDCDENQFTSGYSDQCRVCVPLKVSPETNNVRVRQAIQSREINKCCLIPAQTEYCCRPKKKGLNDHNHMHQPRRRLESFLLAMNMMKRFRRKL